jgi:hypothetical protein
MSKPVAKTQKVTIDEEQSSKIAFENAPKLFSKWSYDDIKVPSSPLRSKTPALSTMSLPSPSNLKSLSPTPLEDTKLRSSEKHSAPSLNVLLAHSNSTEETLVRRPKPSESSGMLLKSSTYLLAKTPCKLSSMPSCWLVPEKTQPESELVVW